MQNILRVEGLSLSFTQYTTGLHQHELTVLHDLSLTVSSGQVVAVVGASGSGKSLLAHAILGLLPYNSHMSGRILYAGQPLTQKRAQTLRGQEIVLVPQGTTCLDPLMQIGTQIRRGSRTAEAVQKCREGLKRYGLGPETEQMYPFELSGGMARRVLIATAAMERPRLVVADEPTPGLDARSAKRMLGHFRELAEAGAAVLFITHDLELALTVADQIVVLYAGETIEQTTPDRLRHPYTRALWQALPQNGFHTLPGTQPYPGEITQGCQFAPRCPICRADCRKRAHIPYRQTDTGHIRCLYDGEDET